MLYKNVSVGSIDFEAQRKVFFLAMKEGRFREALLQIPSEPEQRLRLLMSASPSGKNVMYWLVWHLEHNCGLYYDIAA